MSIQQNFPGFSPSLNLNFARSKRLDPRVTFSRETAATVTNKQGFIEVVGNNIPRFDHVYDSSIGTVRSLGLLIEEERANLLHYTDFSNGYWGGYCGNKTGVSYNTTDVISPDGKNTATKIVTGPTLGCTGSIPGRGLIFNQNLDITTLVDTYTISLYVRGAVGGEVLFFGLTDSYQANYTLTTEWQRITFTGINNRTDYQLGRIFQFGTNNLNATYYVWGPQAELGSFPTSYIPTAGLPTTRLADNAYIDGENFSSFYNQIEGTVFASFQRNTNGTVRVFNIDDGTNTNRISGLASDVFYQTYVNPAATGTTATFSETNTYKVASGHQDNSVQVYVNGFYQQSNTSITIPKNLNTFRIGNWHNNTFQGTTISQLVYYPRRLTNDQLQQLTR